jgi:hypothetical protein
MDRKKSTETTSITVNLTLDSSHPQTTTITKTQHNALDFYSAKYLNSENENLLDYKTKLAELVADHDVIMTKDLKEYQHAVDDYNEQMRFYEQLWVESNRVIADLVDVIDELKGELRSASEGQREE